MNNTEKKLRKAGLEDKAITVITTSYISICILEENKCNKEKTSKLAEECMAVLSTDKSLWSGHSVSFGTWYLEKTRV